MAVLNHPLAFAILLPLGITLALAGLLRLGLGPERSGAALGLGVLSAHLLRGGVPHLPPAGAADKLVYLIGVATLVGTLLESRARLSPWLFGIAMLLAVLWLGVGRWNSARATGDYLLLAAVAAVTPLMLATLSRHADTPRLLVVLLLAGTSLAMVASSGRAAPIALDAAAVAAAAAALLWWILAGATPPRVAVLLAGGGGLVALAANLALYGAPPLLALAVWVPVLLLPAWAAPLPALLAPLVAWRLAG